MTGLFAIRSVDGELPLQRNPVIGIQVFASGTSVSASEALSAEASSFPEGSLLSERPFALLGFGVSGNVPAEFPCGAVLLPLLLPWFSIHSERYF